MRTSVFSIILPTAFFAALDRGAQSIAANGALEYPGSLLTDSTRDQILRMSRGLAVVLLVVYISSRVFLHIPSTDQDSSQNTSLPTFQKSPTSTDQETKPQKKAKVGPWIGLSLLIFTIALMSTTAEFVSAIHARCELLVGA